MMFQQSLPFYKVCKTQGKGSHVTKREWSRELYKNSNANTHFWGEGCDGLLISLVLHAIKSVLLFFNVTVQHRSDKDEIKNLKVCSGEYEVMLHEYKNQVDDM